MEDRLILNEVARGRKSWQSIAHLLHSLCNQQLKYLYLKRISWRDPGPSNPQVASSNLAGRAPHIPHISVKNQEFTRERSETSFPSKLALKADGGIRRPVLVVTGKIGRCVFGRQFELKTLEPT